MPTPTSRPVQKNILILGDGEEITEQVRNVYATYESFILEDRGLSYSNDPLISIQNRIKEMGGIDCNTNITILSNGNTINDEHVVKIKKQRDADMIPTTRLLEAISKTTSPPTPIKCNIFSCYSGDVPKRAIASLPAGSVVMTFGSSDGLFLRRKEVFSKYLDAKIKPAKQDFISEISHDLSDNIYQEMRIAIKLKNGEIVTFDFAPHMADLSKLDSIKSYLNNCLKALHDGLLVVKDQLPDSIVLPEKAPDVSDETTKAFIQKYFYFKILAHPSEPKHIDEAKKFGFDINSNPEGLNSLLSQAKHFGELKLTEELILRGAMINTTNPNTTPSHLIESSNPHQKTSFNNFTKAPLFCPKVSFNPYAFSFLSACTGVAFYLAHHSNNQLKIGLYCAASIVALVTKAYIFYTVSANNKEGLPNR